MVKGTSVFFILFCATWCTKILHGACCCIKKIFTKNIYNFLAKNIVVIAPAAVENRLAIVHVKRTHYGVVWEERDRQTEIGMGVAGVQMK